MSELVSIVTPSYNTGKWIGETIESVLQQTYRDWEMLIVDDCSTDNTEEVVSYYNDTRIRFIKNEKNSGAAISRNRAIREAKGNYIAFLDSDDLWAPNKLEKQIKFMKDNQYAFTCTYCDYVDEDTKPLKKLDTCPSKIGKIGMYLYNWIGCLTVIYHVPTVGLIQIEDIKKRNDYALWLKVIKKTDCYCLKENLASYRVRKKSISHDSFRKLIKSHFTLYNTADKKSCFVSLSLTIVNLFFGAIRKLFFIKNI